MDDPNITMEEYIRLEEEKARKRGKVYNWETAKYGKICIEDVHVTSDPLTRISSYSFLTRFTSEVRPSYNPRDVRKVDRYRNVNLVIMESLVKKKQKDAILELKRKYLKNTIFCTYTPYPAMKIQRISASSIQETRNDQFSIRRLRKKYRLSLKNDMPPRVKQLLH
ncbi:hypothetical protein Tco_0865715 [Tanacetum coccineum]